MLMENGEIERLGGNKKVHKQLSSFSPEAFSILKRMEDTITHLRVPRNKVAHQSGFSSKNLCILQTIESSAVESISVKMITDIMSYDEIKDIVVANSLEQFKSVAIALDKLVAELIDSLSFVYSGIINSPQGNTR